MRYRKKKLDIFFIEGDAGDPFYRLRWVYRVRAVRNAPKSVPRSGVCWGVSGCVGVCTGRAAWCRYPRVHLEPGSGVRFDRRGMCGQLWQETAYPGWGYPGMWKTPGLAIWGHDQAHWPVTWYRHPRMHPEPGCGVSF